MKMTYAIAHAASKDAANRSMHKAGRTSWNEDDWNAAVREFDRLLPDDNHHPRRTPMESFTLPRTGHQPLQFTGELLAEAKSQREKGNLAKRWHELALYRTAGGQYVLAIEYRSEWPGETGHQHVAVLDSLPAVAAALQGHDPVLRVQGYPEGAQFETRQQRLRNDVAAGYNSAVSKLMAGGDFAERIE